MTKEEALKVLIKMRTWRRWNKEQKEEERPEMPEQKEVDEAFDVCIEMLSKPSLPSDLDEVVEKSSQKRYSPVLNGSGNDICYPKRSVFKQGFKAGAEWMAGQGYVKEGIARPDDCEIWVNMTNVDIKDGDEVIVQIRKK